MDNNMNSVIYNQEVRCPGKEITTLAMGISSLAYGIFGAMFGWYPVYGWITGGIFAIFGLACAIVAKVLYKKVMEEATTYTNKVNIGNRLGTAGMIVSIIALALMIISIIVIIVLIATLGVSYLSDYF